VVCPVERLAVALVGRSSDEELAGAFMDALPYVQPDTHERHSLVTDPTGRAARVLTEAYPWWAASGYSGIRAKPHRLPADAYAVLDGVLKALRLADCRLLVPHWLTPTMMLALNQPDAVDLRSVARSSGWDACAVPAACLAFLNRFANAYPQVREAMRNAGAPPPIPFPVGTRYVTARARLAQLAGDDVANRLPGTVGDDRGRRVLFCDPKPANLILPNTEVDRWRATRSPDPIGVDLDLACHDSSCALQAVLAAFSTPLPATHGEDREAELAGRHRQVHEACGRFNADPVRVDGLVVYHLVRNFTHAVDGGDRAKAVAFGETLCGVGKLLGLDFGPDGRERVRTVAVSVGSPVGSDR
jgi:hypothetical protein